MTTKFSKTATAALAAAIIGSASLTAPALAAGQVSVNFTPTDPDQQQALGMGLQMFSLFKGLSATGANASQNGNFNSAGFNQTGSGNHGLIVQLRCGDVDLTEAIMGHIGNHVSVRVSRPLNPPKVTMAAFEAIDEKMEGR